MIFTTITLNPCLDRREYLHSLEVGATNRPYQTRVSAGGKGINVSKALVDLIKRHQAYAKASVNTVTFAGGKTGEEFCELLKDAFPYGGGVTLLKSGYDTRVCTKLITPYSHTEINGEGKISENEIKALIELVADLVANGGEQIVFLSGSMPTIVCEDGFTQENDGCGSFPHLLKNPVENSLITLLESCGIRVIVDTSKKSLVESLKASPSLIKPNESELSELFGRAFSDENELVDFCRELYVDNGCEVLCTLGEKGALYVGKEGVFKQDSHRVFPCDPTGAGDTFLAAFAFARYVKELSPRESLAFANDYVREYLEKSLT